MKNFMKDITYGGALFLTKIYWRIIRPRTRGARILLVMTPQHQDTFFLVQHRRSRTWDLPGGGLKKNEDPYQGALRELYEETGYRISDHETGELLGTYISHREGKQDTITIHVVSVEKTFVERNKLRFDIEIQDAQWYTYDQLPADISPATRRRIDEYRRGDRECVGAW